MSQTILLPSGEGGFINVNEIIAVGRTKSAPIHRAIKDATKNHRLIDITFGKASYWAIFTRQDYVIITGKELNLKKSQRETKINV